jgi:hypothetical protein
LIKPTFYNLGLKINIKLSCDNKLIKQNKNTKFLGLNIDNSLSLKNHIDQMMIKLSTESYAIRYVKHFMSQHRVRTIFYIFFYITNNSIIQ